MLDDKTFLKGKIDSWLLQCPILAIVPKMEQTTSVLLTLLVEGKFLLGDNTNILHMAVKPQDVIDDEDARIAKGGSRERDGSERSPGCRCIIM